jgi:hypothetical protein
LPAPGVPADEFGKPSPAAGYFARLSKWRRAGGVDRHASVIAELESPASVNLNGRSVYLNEGCPCSAEQKRGSHFVTRQDRYDRQRTSGSKLSPGLTAKCAFRGPSARGCQLLDGGLVDCTPRQATHAMMKVAKSSDRVAARQTGATGVRLRGGPRRPPEPHSAGLHWRSRGGI